MESFIKEYKVDSSKIPTIFLGILSIIVGGMILSGWEFDVNAFVQVSSASGVSEPLSGFYCIISGFMLVTLGVKKIEQQQIALSICGLLFIFFPIIIIFQQKFQVYPTIDQRITNFLFPQSIFANKSMALNVAFNWMLIGLTFFISAHVKKKAMYMVMQLLGFSALVLSIIGFVSYTNAFDLLYEWYQYLIMPIHTSIGIITICVGLLGSWGQNKVYQTFYAGQEDRKILIFSGALLIQVAVTAGVIGFAIIAQQNEKFLKNSFKQSLEMKSVIVREEIKNEINEINDFVKFPNIIEFFKTFPNVASLTKEEVSKLFISQSFNAWKLVDAQGKTLFSDGKFVEESTAALPLSSVSGVSLIWNDGWHFFIQKDVLSEGEKIGSLILEKPLKSLDYTLIQEQVIGSNEEKILCSHLDFTRLRCFTSTPTEQSFNIVSIKESDDTPISRALNGNKGVMLTSNFTQQNAISAYSPIDGLGLVLIVTVKLEEIYQNIYAQLKVTLPLMLWFIVFNMLLLSWQVIPLVRKVILSEKDAVENARLLIESELRLRAIINNIGEAILTLDENGIIESWNTTASDIFGYSNSDILGKNINVLIYLANQENTRSFVESYLGNRRWEEIIAIRSDGSFFSAEFYMSEIKVRQKRIYVGILRDITERKRSEQRIQESENRFRSSFDFAPIGMALISMNERWLQVNQSLSSIVGYTEAELMNLDFYQIIYPDDTEYCRNSFLPVFQGVLKTSKIEMRYIHKNGQIVWVYVTVFMMNDDGKPLYLIAQIQDITERKVVENELKSVNDQLKKRFDELELHTQESALLTEMSRILQSCLTTEEAYGPIETYCRQLMPYTSGVLYFSKVLSNYMEPIAIWGQPSQSDNIISTKDCWGLRRGQIHVVDSVCSQIFCAHVQDVVSKISGHLCIPMMAQGETIGLMYIEFSKNEGEGLSPIDDSIRVLASTLADHIALSLSNIRLRETLQHQSMHDPLTGLYNRRYLEEFMRLEFLRAARKDTTLAVVMLDIDFFKRFNDTFGHEAGDLVLQEIANVLLKNVRESDIACRLGGEEFLLLLPETSVEVTLQRAESIRQAVRALKLFHLGKSLGDLSISIGISFYPQHGQTAQQLMELADQALYEAKGRGRDRIVMSGETEFLLESGEKISSASSGDESSKIQ